MHAFIWRCVTEYFEDGDKQVSCDLKTMTEDAFGRALGAAGKIPYSDRYRLNAFYTFMKFKKLALKDLDGARAREDLEKFSRGVDDSVTAKNQGYHDATKEITTFMRSQRYDGVREKLEQELKLLDSELGPGSQQTCDDTYLPPYQYEGIRKLPCFCSPQHLKLPTAATLQIAGGGRQKGQRREDSVKRIQVIWLVRMSYPI